MHINVSNPYPDWTILLMSKIEFDPEVCNFKNEKKRCPCCGMRAASENALHNCRANPIYQQPNGDVFKVELPDDKTTSQSGDCTSCEKIKRIKAAIEARKAELAARAEKLQ